MQMFSKSHSCNDSDVFTFLCGGVFCFGFGFFNVFYNSAVGKLFLVLACLWMLLMDLFITVFKVYLLKNLFRQLK